MGTRYKLKTEFTEEEYKSICFEQIRGNCFKQKDISLLFEPIPEPAQHYSDGTPCPLCEKEDKRKKEEKKPSCSECGKDYHGTEPCFKTSVCACGCVQEYPHSHLVVGQSCPCEKGKEENNLL